jgi:hypothetical protein
LISHGKKSLWNKTYTSVVVCRRYNRFSTELKNRRKEQVLPMAGKGRHWWKEGGDREKIRRMNTMQIMYIYVCKYKNDTC